MNRRDFLRSAGAATGAAAVGAAGTAAAQEETDTPPDGNDTATDSGAQTPTPGQGEGDGESTPSEGGGGATETVAVGPGGEFVFDPGTEEPLVIEPGTTVVFEWESDNHNIVVESQPDDADWPGHEPIENTGFVYEYTFEVEGTYEYVCVPHESLGMIGTIEVTTDTGGGGGGGATEVDPEEMGVPIQAHFVGLATVLAILGSLVFTFFTLKYGESAHTSAPNKK